MCAQRLSSHEEQSLPPPWWDETRANYTEGGSLSYLRPEARSDTTLCGHALGQSKGNSAWRRHFLDVEIKAEWSA